MQTSRPPRKPQPQVGQRPEQELPWRRRSLQMLPPLLPQTQTTLRLCFQIWAAADVRRCSLPADRRTQGPRPSIRRAAQDRARSTKHAGVRGSPGHKSPPQVLSLSRPCPLSPGGSRENTSRTCRSGAATILLCCLVCPLCQLCTRLCAIEPPAGTLLTFPGSSMLLGLRIRGKDETQGFFCWILPILTNDPPPRLLE